MSDGRKYWYDLEQEEAHKARLARLIELDYGKIMDIVDNIELNIRYLEIDKMRLTRSEWQRLDGIRTEVKKLL